MGQIELTGPADEEGHNTIDYLGAPMERGLLGNRWLWPTHWRRVRKVSSSPREVHWLFGGAVHSSDKSAGRRGSPSGRPAGHLAIVIARGSSTAERRPSRRRPTGCSGGQQSAEFEPRLSFVLSAGLLATCCSPIVRPNLSASCGRQSADELALATCCIVSLASSPAGGGGAESAGETLAQQVVQELCILEPRAPGLGIARGGASRVSLAEGFESAAGTNFLNFATDRKLLLSAGRSLSGLGFEPIRQMRVGRVRSARNKSNHFPLSRPT